MIEGLKYQQDKTTGNTYPLTPGTPKYSKQILTGMKGERDNTTKVLVNFNAPLSAIDRWSRQKINKETLELKHILD